MKIEIITKHQIEKMIEDTIDDKLEYLNKEIDKIRLRIIDLEKVIENAIT
jgi:hypothetical protein